ncbi:hypothetical protein ACX280_05690 [Cetobacterium somerae]
MLNNELKMIEITLGDTYLEKGFFNVPLYISNKLFNSVNGECEIKIKEKISECKYRITNKNGQIRVFGGKLLRDYFKNNFNKLDKIEVTIIVK